MMNRRHFISLGGISLTGLLFTKWVDAKEVRLNLIHLPLKISIKLGDGIHQLTSLDKKSYTYKDVTVRLKYLGDSLSVSVQSPTTDLHHVRLEWDYQDKEKATLIGDHWERTYGDINFIPANPNKKLPWYFILSEGLDTTCFGVKTGSKSLCYWQLGLGKMLLTMDTTSGGKGVRLGDRVLELASVMATKNIGAENSFETAHRFCGLMCVTPRLPKKPVYGINDWYFAYGKNSSELILTHTRLLADLATDLNNRPFSVVDAGWASYAPELQGDCCWQDDFSKPNANFKDMAKLAEEIKSLGMRPGLWTRPLCGSHADSASRILPIIAGRNEAHKPVLDPTIPENLERIKHNISTYKAWGYEMVKHDFTTYDMFGKWGFEMENGFTAPNWHFYDQSLTNAEIILKLYSVIREAAGPMYLIGCNTFSHLSAGLFELNRIGDDTSGNEWDRTRKMGVNTLGFRLVQHNKFYAADGDCVGLTTKVPWEKNKQWMDLLAQSSSPLFISAQPDALGAEQRKFVKACFTTAAKVLPLAEPLDWLKTALPENWKLNGQVKKFDWI